MAALLHRFRSDDVAPALCRTLRRMQRRGGLSDEHRAAVERVKSDLGLTALLIDKLNDMDPVMVGDLHTAAGKLKAGPVLQWLWDHREKILELILSILAKLL